MATTFGYHSDVTRMTRVALAFFIVVALLMAVGAGFPWSERFF
jgi:hypothetical protein